MLQRKRLLRNDERALCYRMVSPKPVPTPVHLLVEIEIETNGLGNWGTAVNQALGVATKSLRRVKALFNDRFLFPSWSVGCGHGLEIETKIIAPLHRVKLGKSGPDLCTFVDDGSLFCCRTFLCKPP